jgi:hypothetical protein
VTLAEEVLSTWREAERLLATVRPLSPDEQAIRLVILTLRECYQELTRQRPPRPTTISQARATVDRARVLLAQIRAEKDDRTAIGDAALGEAPG